MKLVEEIFKKHKLIENKLLDYGFNLVQENSYYLILIMSG